MTVHERVEEEIKRNPGQTALEIAQALFGNDGYQQRVNGACLWLWRHGQVRRDGRGGAGDPYRYTFIRA
jgi:hypothetical protein